MRPQILLIFPLLLLAACSQSPSTTSQTNTSNIQVILDCRSVLVDQDFLDDLGNPGKQDTILDPFTARLLIRASQVSKHDFGLSSPRITMTSGLTVIIDIPTSSEMAFGC